MKTTFVLLTLLVAVLAGCSSKPSTPPTEPGAATGSLELQSIVPGHWTVSSATDFMYVWVHNPTASTVKSQFTMTGRSGKDLPAGWAVSFSRADAELGGNGSLLAKKSPIDWSVTLVTLTVPTDATGVHQAELHFGDTTRPILIDVQSTTGDVSRPGDHASFHYRGTFQDNGEEFDAGDLTTHAQDRPLGQGGFVPGFDNGLIGLAAGESVTLQLPSTLAYGHTTQPQMAEFQDRDLTFEITMTTVEHPAPIKTLEELMAPCIAYNDVPDSRDPLPMGQQDGVQVRFTTTLGEFVLEMDAAHAPKTVDNFLRYVDAGFYACTVFHRLGPEFMVQGGGFLPNMVTHKPTNPPVELEATQAAPNVAWSVAMARTSDPDSATSEFFINVADNRDCLDAVVGQCDPSGAGYTVFAHLISGEATINAMLEVPHGRQIDGASYQPAEPILILHAERL